MKVEPKQTLKWYHTVDTAEALTHSWSGIFGLEKALTGWLVCKLSRH